MENKTIVGFEVDKEFKDRIIKAGKDYKVNGIPLPLKLCGFCRSATEILVREVGGGKIKWQEK